MAHSGRITAFKEPFKGPFKAAFERAEPLFLGDIISEMPLDSAQLDSIRLYWIDLARPGRDWTRLN